MSTLATWSHVVQSPDVRSRVFSRPLLLINDVVMVSRSRDFGAGHVTAADLTCFLTTSDSAATIVIGSFLY